MKNIAGLLILGFGGHARSVADVALAAGVLDIKFIDINAHEGESFRGFPVLKDWKGELPTGWQVFSASGDNTLRRQHRDSCHEKGWLLARLVAPTATLAVGSDLAEGCFVAQHAHIGPMARIGIGCIVNTGAIIEHECWIGDFTHVSVNATVAGRCRVGSGVMVGAGATVIDGVQIVDDVLIGAGAVVCKSINQAGAYVGNPARKLEALQKGF
jgi:sugar O-acyltransferase (sialic acid O-acetyltransferase NeuD family)